MALLDRVDFVENRQYFNKNNDELVSNKRLIRANIMGESFEFMTDNGVFSKDFLDYATKILLENIDLKSVKGPILDLGCGYGPVGIYMAKMTSLEVVMLDINKRAISLSEQNLALNNVKAKVLLSDSLEAVINDNFMTIISNPPIHAGKDVIYKMFDESYQVLLPGGVLYVVIQYKHGAPSAIKKLASVFQKVDIIYKKKGFFVLKCIKLG